MRSAPLKVLATNTSVKSKVVSDKKTDTTNIQKQVAAETQTVYIVVADTGLNYYALDNEMKSLSHTAHIRIDTGDNYYNKAKNLIALPDTSSDEIYAGEYYPRRYPSESLSLEYLQSYRSTSAEKMIALVAGIYEKKSSADSAVKALATARGKAFAIKTSLYMGCIH